MADDRSGNKNRVYQNVRVLPNELDHFGPDLTDVKGFGYGDKPLTKVSGNMEIAETDSPSKKAPKKVYKATVFMGTPGTKGTGGDPSVGATGYGKAAGLTKNQARQKAYNAASDDKMKETQRVSERMENMEKSQARSKDKKKAKVVKIDSSK